MRSDSCLWGQSDTKTQHGMDRPRHSRSSLRGYPRPCLSQHSQEEHVHSFMASAHM